jgi:hypothetical protein
VAIALALLMGCAIAPSPQGQPTSSGILTPTLTPSGPVVLVAWETTAERASLVVFRADGAIERLALPAVPDDQVAAGRDGRLVFVSGSAADPILWTGTGPPAAPEWSSRRLVAPAGQEEPFSWPCVGPGSPGPLAVQSQDNLVYTFDDADRLAPLPAGNLMLRPGGCAWIDARHLIVSVDIPGPVVHVGFAVLAADGSAVHAIDGLGGEHPAAGGGLLAYAARLDGRNVLLVVPVPAPGGPIAAPLIRRTPSDDGAFFRPVLSDDGRRLAVLEHDAFGRPARLLLYDLEGGDPLVAFDVGDAVSTGPTWVAGAPAP